jgi:hypothetical protein
MMRLVGQGEGQSRFVFGAAGYSGEKIVRQYLHQFCAAGRISVESPLRWIERAGEHRW